MHTRRQLSIGSGSAFENYAGASSHQAAVLHWPRPAGLSHSALQDGLACAHFVCASASGVLKDPTLQVPQPPVSVQLTHGEVSSSSTVPYILKFQQMPLQKGSVKSLPARSWYPVVTRGAYALHAVHT